jgi:putative membrane protein
LIDKTEELQSKYVYDKIIKMEETQTRDNLAKSRTHLANERTFLAYLRTSLAFWALGLVLLKFIPSQRFTILAIVIIAIGFALSAYGAWRFFSFKERIDGE